MRFAYILFLLGMAATLALAANFSTPQGALQALEQAQRSHNIEAAVAAKDFQYEGYAMLANLKSTELGLLTSDGRTRTSETWAPLNVTLDKSHPSTRVRNVKFVVDKQKVDDSMSTTLAVTNDHLLWPLPSELKPDGKSLQSPMGDY